MNAQAILRELRRLGVTIEAQGTQLILDGPIEALTDEAINQLRAAKSQLLQLLDPIAGCSRWNPEEWQAYFDERAAIQEFDGGHSPKEAERLALEDTITQWLRLAPPPVPNSSDACIHCGRSEQPGNSLFSLLVGGNHLHVHDWCWTAWIGARRNNAREALSNIGIRIDQGHGISRSKLSRQCS